MASSVFSYQDQVLVEANSSARILTMNRPKQLNAQSIQMLSRLLECFLAYEEDPNVKLIILKGKGRAFSVGGDVATVVRDTMADGWKAGAKFFSKVFTLSYLIATYSKPQVSFLNGIAMGGAACAAVHGRFRVATEKTIFAMPETALGLFPDVAASYFLSRLPGFFGEYVGLTGSRLDGAEMLACGLATHFVPSAKLPMLEAALCNVDSSEPVIISSIIDQYCEQPSLKEQSVYNRLDIIDRCFSKRTVEEILSALEREVVHHQMDGWISATIQTLKKASPTSLKIFLRSIREGRLQGLGPCFIRDYRMVCHIVRGEISRDFFEGCRALLVDKDKNPKWEPSKLELIADSTVDRYFSNVNDEEWEDLKLPNRSKFKLPPYAIAKL